MIKTISRHVVSLALLAVLFTNDSAFAGEEYGRVYSLHTLDYRVAETAVWKICESAGGRAPCRVQVASQDTLTVLATQDVHAQIVEMLSERDRRVPAALLFEMVLVRLIDNGGPGGSSPMAPHQEKALAAVREIFPRKRAEIIDTGLIRTMNEGQTRLGQEGDRYYEAILQVRSLVAGNDGMEITVSLDLAARWDGGVTRVLGTSLTLLEGETVVAGSSSVAGEDAVVVLLTSKEG